MSLPSLPLPSSSSLLENVPKECKIQIYKYLTLRECLNCATLSKTTLQHEIIPELKRRRNVQFLSCHEELVRRVDTNEGPKIVCMKVRPMNTATIKKTNAKSSSASTATATPSNSNNHPYLQPLTISRENDHKTEQWFMLPSVYERVQDLHRSMPSHPLKCEINDLKVDLERVRCDDNQNNDDVRNNQNKINHGESTFSELVQILKRTTNAHRLHSSLLRRCTIDLDPYPSSLSIYDHYNHQATPGMNRRDLTVTLDQYMGDVLSAYYLTAHSLAGIVEGGPSFATEWVENHLVPMVNCIDVDRCKDEPYRWYKLWIYLHSTLLRNIPLTVAQAEQHLRLGQMAGITFKTQIVDHQQQQVDIANGNNQRRQHGNTGSEAGGNGDETGDPRTQKVTWFRPPLSFSLGLIDEQSVLLNHSSPPDYVNRIFGSLSDPVNVGMHQTTLNHFGPLGPAFRGRDSVTTQTMSPFGLIGLLANSCQLLLGSDQQETSFGRFLSNDDSLLKWLVDLRNESTRVRPMTVLPPLVTIRVPDL